MPAIAKVGKTTRIEQKALRREQKQVLKKAWSSSSDDFEEEIEEDLDLPLAFCRYTIQDRKILLQKPKR